MEINNLEKFKAKMARGKMCLGTVITLADPIVSEMAGDCGLDFTWIDAEHGPFSLENIQGHVMACRGTDCAPLVRVAWNDFAIIKPVLDIGPAGVIIPMVCTAEEAAEADLSERTNRAPLPRALRYTTPSPGLTQVPRRITT